MMSKMKKTLMVGLALASTVGIALVAFPVIARQLPPDKRHAQKIAKIHAAKARAIQLIEQADTAWHKDGDYVKAEKLFRGAMALMPHDYFLEVGFADMLREQGRKKEAFDLYRAAIHPDASNIEGTGTFEARTLFTYIALSRAVGSETEAKWAVRKIVRSTSGSYPEFPVYTEAQMDSLPVDALAKLAFGLEQDRLGDLQGALATFQSVSTQNPRLGLAYLYIGHELERTIGFGTTSAMNAYRKAIRLGDPTVKAMARKSLEQ